jgi:hypothetical protein
VTFRVAPEHFDTVLAKYPYEEKQLPPGYKYWMPYGVGGYPVLRDDPTAYGFLIPGDLGDYPRERIAYCFSYSEPAPGGGLRVKVFANKDKTPVYLVGFYD